MIRIYLGALLLVAVMVMPFSLSAQTYEEWTDRAMVALEQDSLELAEACLRAALKQDPANAHNALLFSNLGMIQCRQHRYEMALESYTFALNFLPRSVPVLLNRAALCLEMGKEDQARVDYSLVLDLEKENKEALLMRAYIYQRQRNYKAARADYEQLLKLDPQNYNGCLGLVNLERKEQRYEKALSLLDELIERPATEGWQLTPSERALFYVVRAGIGKEMGQTDLALIDLDKALALDVSLPDIYLIRGEIYLLQKKKVLARRDFEKAVALGIPQVEMREWLQQCK